MNDWVKTYLFIGILGVFSGFLFVLRTIQNEAIDTKGKAIRFVTYGIGSSVLITWIGFETFVYLGLPNSLSSALGGGLGFIGAETVARLVIRAFNKKIGE